MSVDIDWKKLTEGPDGARLAETIRSFVDDRFKAITLPKLIRSVKCRGFEFGSVSPQIVLKDICNPLPDFYEDENDDDDDGLSPEEPFRRPVEKANEHCHGPPQNNHPAALNDFLGRTASPALSRAAGTPGILGHGSNLGYFHLPLSAGLSGTATPLAAVAGAQFQNNTRHHEPQREHAESFSSISTPPTCLSTSRPTSRDHNGYFDHAKTSAVYDDSETQTPVTGDHEASPEDLQVVFHMSYDGDVRLALTAEVFLDYPMPSFVGIPLKLNITGMRFDGIGIMAYIKRKAHLCFLAPEDAEALVGGDAALGSPDIDADKPRRIGALLEDIRIESEMGEVESGRQVLKNMGKIEKFVLEQVQRIFEDEFVYPSFWTFLV
ncbi:hypothetical protein LTR62_007121 [Meristemomyces frigidus]|uniref:Mitochondrial distribution and morphology protein 12 n=1 Tax=Meristemomyces frigidus TaxID=1508187 RepID=A0AAN7TJ97_9PEZI|nr:hypothetical protein LTR62_007121 [Meristemomyces frigidus]